MEQRFLKVEGHSYLVRDTESNAIINTDRKGHASYVALRRSKKFDVQRVNTLESDVQELKSNLSDIKSMLRQLLEE
tara:strand:+ start:1882 stop:2109 length:228 start_codon:yes stop_codon:yes gene_type:complete